MSRTFTNRKRRQDIPFVWRLILGFQAAMTAWIGFTHGSGFEVFLFRFAQWNYKSVWSLDHNIAGVIAALGLLVLWRGYSVLLLLLSALYLTETVLMSRFGGYVDNPYPLLGSAVHIVLPLAVLALHKHRWAYRLLQFAIFACLLSFAIYFVTGPQYFVDGIIQFHQIVGGTSMLPEKSAHIVLAGIGLFTFASFFAPSRTGILQLIAGLFSVAWALDSALRFGLWHLPESLLKLTLLCGVILLWQGDPARRGRGRYPSLGGPYG
jgi:hypothetical protein